MPRDETLATSRKISRESHWRRYEHFPFSEWMQQMQFMDHYLKAYCNAFADQKWFRTVELIPFYIRLRINMQFIKILWEILILMFTKWILEQRHSEWCWCNRMNFISHLEGERWVHWEHMWPWQRRKDKVQDCWGSRLWRYETVAVALTNVPHNYDCCISRHSGIRTLALTEKAPRHFKRMRKWSFKRHQNFLCKKHWQHLSVGLACPSRN